MTGACLSFHVSFICAARFETIRCCRDALGEATRAAKRRPSENADETFFAPIFLEDVFDECFVYLIGRLREYESQTRYRPILPGHGRGLRIHPATADGHQFTIPGLKVAHHNILKHRRDDDRSFTLNDCCPTRERICDTWIWNCPLHIRR